MILDQLLKGRKNPFAYCEVITVDTVGQRVQVQSGDFTTWINTDLTLSIGDTVIVAMDENKQKFIINTAANGRPTVNTLLSL